MTTMKHNMIENEFTATISDKGKSIVMHARGYYKRVNNFIQLL
jgi:hypothetical protein